MILFVRAFMESIQTNAPMKSSLRWWGFRVFDRMQGLGTDSQRPRVGYDTRHRPSDVRHPLSDKKFRVIFDGLLFPLPLPPFLASSFTITNSDHTIISAHHLSICPVVSSRVASLLYAILLASHWERSLLRCRNHHFRISLHPTLNWKKSMALTTTIRCLSFLQEERVRFLFFCIILFVKWLLYYAAI